MRFPISGCSAEITIVLLWVFFSLLAIANNGDRPYVGLAVAVVGGIVLGVASFRRFEETRRRRRGPGAAEARETSQE